MKKFDNNLYIPLYASIINSLLHFQASSSLRIMAILNQMGISFSTECNSYSVDGKNDSEIKNGKEIDDSIFNAK